MTTVTRDARALTLEALTQLLNALREASDPTDFLGRADAIVHRPSNHLQLRDEHGTPDPLDGSRSRGGIDVDNAPLVHEYLGEIDRANASDPRLWTYLAFVTYRPYMEERWPLSGDPWRTRAETRWLMPRVNRPALVRHGIARLWWLTHLTYEPRPSEPGGRYARTRTAFANEDRIIV